MARQRRCRQLSAARLIDVMGLVPVNVGADARQPLSILMLNYEYPPIGGGTGVACEQLLGALGDVPGLTVDLVTSGPDGLDGEATLPGGITIHRLPVAKRDRHFWRANEIAQWSVRAMFHARRLAARKSFDLCHCWAGWPSGVVGCTLPRSLPLVVSLRGSDVPGYNRRLRLLDPALLRFVVRHVWRRAVRVVAVSDALRQLALETAPETAIDVIPNGVDTEMFRPGDGPCRTDLLFAGRLIERKAVGDLIVALGQLVAGHPGLRLTIAGDGPERRRLEGLARRMGQDGQIIFAGHLERDALAAAYRQAGIFVLPALADAMPNVVLEAMAAGLAIVTTPGGAQDLISGNGLPIEPRDPASITRAVRRYLADPELLARHQRASRELAETMSWQVVADYFLAIYREVAGGVCVRAA
jgi:glycosyltransferase involved in cell wall biosynthesis